MDIWKIKGSIDFKSAIDWGEAESQYSPWVINLAYSFNQQLVMYANMMNETHFIPKKWQYDFYFNAIPKGKKTDQWIKKESKTDKHLKMIASYYNINMTRAGEYLQLLSPDQIKIISEKMDKGGVKR